MSHCFEYTTKLYIHALVVLARTVLAAQSELISLDAKLLTDLW